MLSSARSTCTLSQYNPLDFIGRFLLVYSDLSEVSLCQNIIYEFVSLSETSLEVLDEILRNNPLANRRGTAQVAKVNA